MGPLRNAMKDKSPVKIKKFEYNGRFKNIVIKHNTTVTPSEEALPFGAHWFSRKSSCYH